MIVDYDNIIRLAALLITVVVLLLEMFLDTKR